MTPPETTPETTPEPTPRTDAAFARALVGQPAQVSARLMAVVSESRSLERELAAANARITELEAERDNWRVSSVCREQAARLALAEGLAAALEHVKEVEPYSGLVDPEIVDKALSAWNQSK